MKDLTRGIREMIAHWERQGIHCAHRSRSSIDRTATEHHLHLPNDFKYMYSRVDGMQDKYPNYMDAEGFLFYPVESVRSVGEEFGLEPSLHPSRYIFADYMHESWWYGVEVESDSKYVIGILPEPNTFRPITDSLAEFIDLYLRDSSKLYEY